MLIDVVRKDNNEKAVIPAHWLDHPVLGAAFKPYPRINPKADAAEPTKKEK